MCGKLFKYSTFHLKLELKVKRITQKLGGNNSSYKKQHDPSMRSESFSSPKTHKNEQFHDPSMQSESFSSHKNEQFQLLWFIFCK